MLNKQHDLINSYEILNHKMRQRKMDLLHLKEKEIKKKQPKQKRLTKINKSIKELESLIDKYSHDIVDIKKQIEQERQITSDYYQEMKNIKKTSIATKREIEQQREDQIEFSKELILAQQYISNENLAIKDLLRINSSSRTKKIIINKDKDDDDSLSNIITINNDQDDINTNLSSDHEIDQKDQYNANIVKLCFYCETEIATKYDQIFDIAICDTCIPIFHQGQKTKTHELQPLSSLVNNDDKINEESMLFKVLNKTNNQEEKDQDDNDDDDKQDQNDDKQDQNDDDDDDDEVDAQALIKNSI